MECMCTQTRPWLKVSSERGLCFVFVFGVFFLGGGGGGGVMETELTLTPSGIIPNTYRTIRGG